MNNNAVITVLLCIVVFIVGFGVGRMTVSSPVTSTPVTNTAPNTPNTADVADEAAVESATTINTSSLTDGQRQMLEALGIDADSITITPEMVACAEAKLGAARVEEIKNGASPSFTEGASLVACYR